MSKRSFAGSWLQFTGQRVIVRTNALLHTHLSYQVRRHDRKLIDCAAANRMIYQWIVSGEPGMAGRFGSVEAGVLYRYFGQKEFCKPLFPYRESDLRAAFNNAGIFPYGAAGCDLFAAEMEQAVEQVDLLASWNVPMFEYLEEKCVHLSALASLECLEPYLLKDGVLWTKALKGKRVLVIHPFAETIRTQYEKRAHLFENPDILPEFELLTLKAVQTIAGNRDDRFADWKAALDYMENEAVGRTFDVAVIGAGAYGFPLAARIKRDLGRPAVHMGGATQLLFGIMGKRWENQPTFRELQNEYWARPAPEEHVAGENRIEGGCYW